MGYAGYAPGKYAPPKPTEVQAALRQVARQDSYELLSKLLRNVVRPLLVSQSSKTTRPCLVRLPAAIFCLFRAQER